MQGKHAVTSCMHCALAPELLLFNFIIVLHIIIILEWKSMAVHITI